MLFSDGKLTKNGSAWINYFVHIIPKVAHTPICTQNYKPLTTPSIPHSYFVSYNE